MTDTDRKKIDEEAIKFIKQHKKELCLKFADPMIYPSIKDPSAYFMAGSPGAGKTEYSKSFIKILEAKEPTRKIVRIDADEIKQFIPQYTGKNSDHVQGASALGVDKLIDCVFKNKQDFLLDGTMARYSISYRNIVRSLDKDRKTGIVYLYQDPLLAWKFTKIREVEEGRMVPKDLFIDAFFSSKDNVNKIKTEFGNKIELWLIIKDFEKGIEKTYFNIDNIDNYLKIDYNREELIDKII